MIFTLSLILKRCAHTDTRYGYVSEDTRIIKIIDIIVVVGIGKSFPNLSIFCRLWHRFVSGGGAVVGSTTSYILWKLGHFWFIYFKYLYFWLWRRNAGRKPQSEFIETHLIICYFSRRRKNTNRDAMIWRQFSHNRRRLPDTMLRRRAMHFTQSRSTQQLIK